MRISKIGFVILGAATIGHLCGRTNSASSISDHANPDRRDEIANRDRPTAPFRALGITISPGEKSSVSQPPTAFSTRCRDRPKFQLVEKQKR